MYNPRDWYYRLGDGRIFSSKRQAFVAIDDSAYVAWLSINKAPSAGAPTLAELQEVLSRDGLFVDPVAYANVKQWALAIGGKTIAINGAPVRFDTSPTSLSLIGGMAQRFQQSDAPASVNWQTGPSTFVTISAADFISAAKTIADFVQSTFNALKVVVAAVATGTITTIADVDAANWPTGS